MERIKKAFKQIGGKGKQVTLLSGDWSGPYAMAAVSINKIKAPAEIHKNSADIWQVLAGQAVFILGGKLVAPKEVGIGEFAAETISGGKRIKVSAGDIINIPAGTAHQIDASNKRVKLLIVKVNSRI